MTRSHTALLLTVVFVAATGIALANNLRDLRADLSGYQEVPTLSTSGTARFEARINKDETEVEWQLSYADTESAVTAVRAGATYANVHTSNRPTGEMRGQIIAHDAGQSRASREGP